MEKPAAGKKKSKKNTPVDLSGLGEAALKPVFPRPRKLEPASRHEFWKSQPVPLFADNAVIATNKGYLTETLDGVRTTPFPLPEGLEWAVIDLNNPADLGEIHQFLCEHYVNGNPNIQFAYSKDFLRWAMCPPGYSSTLHVGVRSHITHCADKHCADKHCADKQLVGFISGAPCTVRAYGTAVRMVEINFLCIRKDQREGKLAMLLIEEVARRVRFLNIWQAIYTSMNTLPHSLATVRYYHRKLNFRKLVETKFTSAREGVSITAQEALHNIPEAALLQQNTVRALSRRDISGACRLVNKFLSSYHIAQEFTKEEFTHTFLPAETAQKFVYSYVIISGGVITGFISFYSIDHKVNVVCKHKEIRAAYSFYNVAGAHSWVDLMTVALKLAKQKEFDVFNCLDIMENSQFIEKLKFTEGTGGMRYYLYNWDCEPTQSSGVGVVLK